MKILIAEDTKAIQILLTHHLKKWGHEVIVADDGVQAWEIIKETPIQFLISDWMMPGMDGLTLCRKIREANFPGYIYIILLTAIGNKEGIVKGMEAGADDYLGKPFDSEELRVRIQAGIRLLHLESELQERNDRLAETYGRIRRDLDAAAAMQKSLLPAPSTAFGNAHFDWLFLPSAFVAGDILNYFRVVDDHHVAFYQLDVSGHGVPSAMLSVTLSKLLSPETRVDSLLKSFSVDESGSAKCISPEKTVTELNNMFQGGEGDFYFTMVYGVLDTNTGELQFCQAGHPSPIIMHAGESAEKVGEGGFPVGMLPDLSYDSHDITLKSGDRFFLYSDGITECASLDTGEMFGESRLMRFFEDKRDLSIRQLNVALNEILVEWRGGEELEDDVSLLVLEMK